jgi:hypothetical protein
MIKMMLEVILSEETDVDEKLGMKNSNNISVPFKIAFNSSGKILLSLKREQPLSNWQRTQREAFCAKKC